MLITHCCGCSSLHSNHPFRSDEMLITPWVFFRYAIIGTYVGIATVCTDIMGWVGGWVGR